MFTDTLPLVTLILDIEAFKRHALFTDTFVMHALFTDTLPLVTLILDIDAFVKHALFTDTLPLVTFILDIEAFKIHALKMDALITEQFDPIAFVYRILFTFRFTT